MSHTYIMRESSYQRGMRFKFNRIGHYRPLGKHYKRPGLGNHTFSTLRGRSLRDIVNDQQNEKGSTSSFIPHHTNLVLDYFGFPDGRERNDFFAKYGATPQDGADFARAAGNLALFYGLKGQYGKTPQKARDIFVAIMDSVKSNGTPNTDYLLSRTGFKGLVQAINRYGIKSHAWIGK